jgi:WD40 repeat protein
VYDIASGKELVPHRTAPCEGDTPWAFGWARSLVAVPERVAGAAKTVRLKLWGAAAGREAVTCDGEFDAVRFAVVGPGGREVAAVVTTAAPERSPVIKVWDAATGRERFSRPAGSAPGGGLTWSPDGRRLAHTSLGWPLLRVWDAADGRELFALAGADDAYSTVVFSPDGTRLAGVDFFAPARFVTLRDADTGRVRATLNQTEEHVYGVAFSADGGRLVTLSRFGTVRTWDATASELPTELRFPAALGVRVASRPSAVAVGGDGSRIAAAGPGADDETAFLQVWDDAGKSLLTLTRPCPRDRRPSHQANHAVVLSPDGRRAAWAYGLGKWNGRDAAPGSRLCAVDVATGRELWSRPLDQFAGTFWFSPDGRRLATCFPSFADGGKPLQDTIRFLDVESGREVHSVPTGAGVGSGVFFVQRGDHLVGLMVSDPFAAAPSLRYKVWDLGAGTETASGSCPPELFQQPGEAMAAMTLTRDAARLAVLSGRFDALTGVVRVFDLSGRQVRTFKGLDSSVRAVAVSADGTRLAAAGLSVKLWDAATGHELATFRDGPGGVGHLEFSRDGHRLRALAWAGGRYLLKTWDATPRVGSR